MEEQISDTSGRVPDLACGNALPWYLRKKASFLPEGVMIC